MKRKLREAAKYSMGISFGKRKHLFKLKDNIGTRTNEYKLVMNKFRMEIGSRFPNNRITMFCNCFPAWKQQQQKKNQATFKKGYNEFLKGIM